MKPSRAARHFKVAGRFVYVREIGRGNVNDTYEAVFRAGATVERIILQRVNKKVFSRPEWIMRNMRRVTEHLSACIGESGMQNGREWGFPQIIPCVDGEDYYVDPDGDFWRAMTMIEASASYETVKNAEHALEAGCVLGCFHRLLAGLCIDDFFDTLPGFHVCPLYLEQYDSVLKSDAGRARRSANPEVLRLHKYVDARRGMVAALEDAVARRELETRLIHGDPKVDNIMIDDFTGKGIGIIDLDTVKPGLIHYDFGDALRSLCNPAGEDASHLKDVYFDVELCEAFVRGYLSEARAFLTDADLRYLYASVRLLPFELGLRFLGDYLAGNVYFKVRFEEHNLNRARVQFKLCESIEANEKAIRRVLTAPDGARTGRNRKRDGDGLLRP